MSKVIDDFLAYREENTTDLFIAVLRKTPSFRTGIQAKITREVEVENIVG